jgi:lipopolysaccharide/colanic/teichoic acid biosynthesis glycosyltransferase
VRALRNEIFKTMIPAGILAIFIFYLVPFFEIAPKTNLIIDLFVSFLFIWMWRKINFTRAIKRSKIKVFFLGKSKEAEEFSDFLNRRPQLGYAAIDDFSSADIIVAPEQIRQDEKTAQILYNMILVGNNIVNFEKFYESITGRVPIALISEVWFLENMAETKGQTYEKAKRMMDVLFSLVLFFVFIIICPFVALAIKINSAGPVFIKQKRVGKNGKIFEIIKFRSMYALAPDGSAEENKNQGWSKPGKKDSRVTFVGNIIRKTRIDEIPQVLNIIKGDLSFIGPRPERPEFVKELVETTPYYSMRHLVRPGLSGWAQIHFGGAAAKDAPIKLQYDLYYIKHRSLFLDFLITLKTIKTVISVSGV